MNEYKWIDATEKPYDHLDPYIGWDGELSMAYPVLWKFAEQQWYDIEDQSFIKEGDITHWAHIHQNSPNEVLENEGN